MYQGFYNLTSGMLTQSRNLDVISNNMVNIQTPGYKREQMTSTTFQEEMLYRTGIRDKSASEPLGVTSKIKTADTTHITYTQGSLEQTDGIYDFAIQGSGFFCIEGQNGGRVYTRNGSFEADEEGYLSLGGIGRVLGEDGQPILIDSEDFTVDANGSITVTEDDGSGEAQTRVLGRPQVVDFADYSGLRKEDNGVFSTQQAPIETAGSDNGPQIIWKSLEKSNVDLVDEMSSMMSSQRALQSAAQVLKMYDQVMGRTTADIGKL